MYFFLIYILEQWCTDYIHFLYLFNKYDVKLLAKYEDKHGNNIITLLVAHLRFIPKKPYIDMYINILNDLYTNECKIQTVKRECECVLNFESDIWDKIMNKYRYIYDFYDSCEMPKKYDDYICVFLYQQDISFDLKKNQFIKLIKHENKYEDKYSLSVSKMSSIIKSFHGIGEVLIANQHAKINNKNEIIAKFENIMYKILNKCNKW